MNIKDHKLEFASLYFLISVILGVSLWFLLDKLNISTSKEIAVLFSITSIVCLLTYLSHNKGLLPAPKLVKSGSVIIDRFRESEYARKKYRFSSFIRMNFRLENELDTESITNGDEKSRYRRKSFKNYEDLDL